MVGSDGRFVAEMVVDLDALALGVDPLTDSAQVAAAIRALPPAELEAHVARLRAYFERRVRVRFDGTPAPFAVSFPEHGRPLPRDALPTVLGLTARLEGRVPAGAKALTFWASRSFPSVRLSVAWEGGVGEVRHLLPNAEESPSFLLSGGAAAAESRLTTAGRYLRLGFAHIVPAGVDHVLFVLGLYLLSPRPRTLLLQVSAFTLAHTATLALSTLGVVRLPPAVVEPLIALSIAYVAVENVFTSELTPWRPALVFGFGLLHGLGFAGVLGELGLPRHAFLTGLLSFNLGVELGQVAVLAGAFILLGALRGRASYRSRVVVPLSLAIATTGLYWTVARVLPS